MNQIQQGVYEQSGKIYTENADKGNRKYGEALVQHDGKEFRRWKASRSKIGAAIQKGMGTGMNKDDVVLYLGAASGTTVSHISDILTDGFVVGVEYSDTVIRELVDLSEKRENIAPVLADARNPSEYKQYVDEADFVFQDISQKDQAQIFSKNCESFLKRGGIGMLSIKARSISSSKPKEKIFSDVKDSLPSKLDIIDQVELDPYEKEHMVIKVKSE